MRRSLRWLAVLLAGIWAGAPTFSQEPLPRSRGATATTPTKRKAAEPADQRLATMLEAWERRSADLTSLEVEFRRVDQSPAWEEPESYKGNVSLKSPDLARLEFLKLDSARKPANWAPHETIVCTGAAVLQYSFPTKQIFVHPIPLEERQRAVEEGPLPFLFNMHARDLKQRFALKLASETKGSYVIDAVPRQSHDRELFGRARLWLDAKSFLPTKLVLVAVNGRDTKEYTFGGYRLNSILDTTSFRAEGMVGWKVVQDP